MYNAIFVDDEPLAHIIFKKQVEKEQRLNIKKTFTSSLEALEYLKAKENQKIDIIFTDIEMP